MKKFAKILTTIIATFAIYGCERTELPEEGQSEKGSDTASVTPADPEIVPKGLEGLSLSQTQAEEFNKWLIETGPRADPADRAKKLRSILREDQLPAFQKLLHTGG
jgi:hypothetical protein